MSDDCIFCKIIRGEIPSSKIYEDKDFFAFLDIRPINKGHSLIIPKVHCKGILDFPRAEETDFLEVIKKVAGAVVKAVDADGFNLGMNTGAAAGQIVFHAHMHIIPRFEGDGLKSWPHKELSREEMDETHKRILSALK
ncbi:HIT family protein [Candidatus Woesearchaeota archaeon]|nr:HIT family protein [Candidatus Woesearchaeota archaeon]